MHFLFIGTNYRRLIWDYSVLIQCIKPDCKAR